MAVHVAAAFLGVGRVAEQAVGLAADHEPVHGPADAVGVLAVADGAAFHEHGHAGQGRHRHRVLAAVRLPVAVAVLGLRQVFQALVDDVAVLGGHVLGTGRRAPSARQTSTGTIANSSRFIIASSCRANFYSPPGRTTRLECGTTAPHCRDRRHHIAVIR